MTLKTPDIVRAQNAAGLLGSALDELDQIADEQLRAQLYTATVRYLGTRLPQGEQTVRSTPVMRAFINALRGD